MTFAWIINKKNLRTFITLLVLSLVEKIFWSDKTHEKDFLRPLWNVSIKCKYQVKVSNVSIKCKYQLRASEAGKRVFLANKLIFFSAFELKVSSAGDSLWYFCRHIYFKLNFSSASQIIKETIPNLFEISKPAKVIRWIHFCQRVVQCENTTVLLLKET